MSNNGKRDPRDETAVYSLGTILVKMGAVRREQVEEVLARQRRMTEEELLGDLLVAAGLVSQAQLQEALKAQADLRSRKRHVRARAAAHLAEVSNHRVAAAAREVVSLVRQTSRKRNGDQFPAVALAKSEE